MRRTFSLIISVILLLLGVCSVVLGGAGVAIFGTQGRYEIPVGTGASNGAAVYVSGFAVNVNPALSLVSKISVEATSGNGKQVFIGAGPPSKVQTFLAGVPYSAVSAIGNGQVETSPVPGKSEASPPAGQDFWVLQAQGASPTISWGKDDAGQVLVVMNADGSRGVQSELKLSATSDSVFPLSLALIGLGGVMMLIGFYLLLRRRKGKGQSTSSGPEAL